MTSKTKYYYEPNARITVGKVKFKHVNSVTVTQSVNELGDSAKIVIPRNFKKIKNKSLFDYMKVGDDVIIELGIDGDYKVEFKGFLKEINSDTPVVLHIDDMFYPLKQNNFAKSWDKVSLKEVLNFIIKDYTVEAPDVELGAFQINNVSSYRVIKALKEQYGFTTYIKNSVLKCQFAYDVRGAGKTHEYIIGKNTKGKGNNLKYHRAEDVKVRIKAIANKRNGKKEVVEVGSEDKQASFRTLNFGDLNKEKLKEYAEKEYKKIAFDGYSGTIKGFAEPFVVAGDTIKIIDNNEPDREGSYLVEKTIVKYDLKAGFERESTLSFKI